MKQTFFATPGSPLDQTTQSWEAGSSWAAWDELSHAATANAHAAKTGTIKTGFRISGSSS
jgi:hypothetical protein